MGLHIILFKQSSAAISCITNELEVVLETQVNVVCAINVLNTYIIVYFFHM